MRVQEKTKKILDIWTKTNALPPAMLKRLGDIAKGKAADQKGAYHCPTVSWSLSMQSAWRTHGFSHVLEMRIRTEFLLPNLR
jgi:hypothetical protein